MVFHVKFKISHFAFSSFDVNFDINRHLVICELDITVSASWIKDRQQSAQRDSHFWSYLRDYVMYINLLYVKKKGTFFSFGWCEWHFCEIWFYTNFSLKPIFSLLFFEHRYLA